ncbi:DEKNAAC102935 [Brettanomyces naardenensis]|uniref:DEKNAAC102935 n=1 Tax=Brettanomyces naardenensis TaxID=13370 RepID=A0A448YLX6_BRENA|nr:DEKNAAC102935 [Brettanomyces naardenensis]
MPDHVLPVYQSDVKEGSSKNEGDEEKKPLKFQFVIRFVGNSRDMLIPLQSSLRDVSTRYIRKYIREEDPSLSQKRLKLIHNGRVLMNHTDFEKELRYYTSSGDGEDDDNDSPINIYIHCLVGEDLSKEELAKEEELDTQPEKSTTEAPKGFDRFLSQGFSQQDIQDLRRQFREIHGRYSSGQTEDNLRDLEDRWIDSTVNNEIDEFPANLRASGGNETVQTNGGNTGITAEGGGGGFVARTSNVHRELFVGVCIGFFLGVFALFLLVMEVGGVFNKQTRMAIVSGVIVNVSFGILKAWS